MGVSCRTSLILTKIVVASSWTLCLLSVACIKWVTYDSWLSQPEGVRTVILEVYPEDYLGGAINNNGVHLADSWAIQAIFWAWKLVKANFPVLPTSWKPSDPCVKPTSSKQCKTKKRCPKTTQCLHKQETLLPLNGQKQNFKYKLTKMAAAALFSALLIQIAAAKVSTFDFHSEITRMQSGCNDSHGLIFISDISLHSQDMICLKQ